LAAHRLEILGGMEHLTGDDLAPELNWHATIIRFAGCSFEGAMSVRVTSWAPANAGALAASGPMTSGLRPGLNLCTRAPAKENDAVGLPGAKRRTARRE